MHDLNVRGWQFNMFKEQRKHSHCELILIKVPLHQKTSVNNRAAFFQILKETKTALFDLLLNAEAVPGIVWERAGLQSGVSSRKQLLFQHLQIELICSRSSLLTGYLFREGMFKTLTSQPTPIKAEIWCHTRPTAALTQHLFGPWTNYYQ